MTQAKLDASENNRVTFMPITRPTEFRVQYDEDYLAENNPSGPFATPQGHDYTPSSSTRPNLQISVGPITPTTVAIGVFLFVCFLHESNRGTVFDDHIVW